MARANYFRGSPAERVALRLVDGKAGCREYNGYRDKWGYGQVRIAGTKSHRKAHRVAWEAVHGAIPEGLCVLHRCDNPPCCNVDHLFLGTVADNNADMLAKGRHASSGQTHCKHGHEYTPENTYIHGKQRFCRECQRARRARAS